MFENLKITAVMKDNISTVDPIRLDCVLSTAKAMEILKSDFFSGGKPIGDGERTIKTLKEFLEYSNRVFHASCAILSCEKEFVVSFSKRWNGGHDELVRFRGKGKQEIDTARGEFKSYHKNLIYKPCKEAVFFARGDREKITQLLNDYIFYLGKHSNKGFGFIKEWKIEVIEEDYSLIRNKLPMRYLPVEEFIDKVDIDLCTASEQALIPPARRSDYREACFEPNVSYMNLVNQ